MSEIEKYNLISNIFFIAAILFLILAIVLFFVFNIKKIFMDLSGLTEKRAIKRIAEENESKKDSANQVTDRITLSGKIQRNNTEGFGDVPITSKLKTSELTSAETTLLNAYDTGETTLLNAGETTLLSSSDMGETTVLASNVINVQGIKPIAMTILQDITFINTDMVININ